VAFAFESSPGGAKEHLFTQILSPLRGLDCFESFIPRLAPWATISRPSGAFN
jgi:hypothetical protein